MTRILLVAASAIALSGCSWLGFGHQKSHYGHHGMHAAHGGHYKAKPCSTCTPRLSRWNIEGAVGPSFLVGGDAVTGDRANVNEGVTYNNVDMEDAFENTGLRAELGGSYALAPNTKVTLLGHYVEHEGGERFTMATQNGVDLTGELTDYEAYGAELGLRQYGGIYRAPIVRTMRPYIEGRVGATKTKDIFLRNPSFSPGNDVAFYDGNWQASAAGLVGVETPFVGNSTIGLETGIRYTARQNTENESALVPGNVLAGINNGGDKWSVPLMLRGRYRF